MTKRPAYRHAAIAMTLAAALLASGCKVKDTREDGGEAAPDPSETTLISPDPTPAAAETPVNSIIRPDLEDNPVVESPPEPQSLTIGFPDGGYAVSAGGKRTLRALLDSDAYEEGWPIVLRGHTDSEGDDQGNIFASRKRAEAVAGWLTENGVDEDRIEIIALGEQRPVAPNAKLDGTPNEAGRRANRRVDVWLGEPGSQPPEDTEEEEAEAPRGNPRPLSEPRATRTPAR
ncbi:OmpA family protein [Paraurantiacibacter namhicola]|nr:OmpA family protein [Paraurantiacibacter namhicola]